MTPPPGSPVNDFEDTHVMETRHPLTIPAAIVLGTAVVATALPLPSSTPATATGTAHVTRAYTDKSTHEPGKQATITAEASTEGTVHFSVSHLGVEIDSGDATVTNGKATSSPSPKATSKTSGRCGTETPTPPLRPSTPT